LNSFLILHNKERRAPNLPCYINTHKIIVSHFPQVVKSLRNFCTHFSDYLNYVVDFPCAVEPCTDTRNRRELTGAQDVHPS